MDFSSPLKDDLTFVDDTGNVVDEAVVQRQLTTSAVELEEEEGFSVQGEAQFAH